jgi:3-methyladenine DNA glycosylase AlkD
MVTLASSSGNGQAEQAPWSATAPPIRHAVRMSATARQMLQALRANADPARVPTLQRYFRTGPGEYGEGDRFIGVTMPSLRALARRFAAAPLDQIDALLQSPIHEARLLALLLLVQAFRRGDERERRSIYLLYVSRTRHIDNWDLVDASAAHIVGGWLSTRSRAPLRRLARSSSVWERRIAIIATYCFIRQGDHAETFAIADLLLADDHDLIHKAVGWMLREVGNRDGDAERRFLASRHTRMPRTMLRYAIEKFPEPERRQYLRVRRS